MKPPFIQRLREAVAIMRGHRVEYVIDLTKPPFDDRPPLRATPVLTDPIAGELHPMARPCRVFVGDGRSNICATCDWPSDAHTDEALLADPTTHPYRPEDKS